MTEYYDLSDLKHDPKLAEALGNMVVAWARAESAVAFILSEVSGMNPNMTQHGFYRIPTFEARIKFILALIEEWPAKEEKKKKFTHVLEKINKLASARNHWVHGIWCKEGDSNNTVLFHLRADGDGRRRPIKAADINNHISALLGRVAEIQSLTPSAPWT